MLPYFVKQRDVYEVREAPSRTFSWFAFIAGQITSEIPYQVAVGTIAFSVGIIHWDCIIMLHQLILSILEGVLMWMLVTAFYVYSNHGSIMYVFQ